MFPIVHTYANKRLALQNKLKLDQTQIKLYILGGIMPDLAIGMGLSRNYGHQMGKEFYYWCEQNAKDALPFAYGAWLHGTDPAGLDYYSDEHWHGGNGWCFQKCTPYMNMVEKACHIPKEWALWKGHNFIEMAMELVTCDLEPTIPEELVEARLDHEAVSTADALLHLFAKTESGLPTEMYHKVPAIFALEGTTAHTLAERYKTQLKRMHQIENANASAIAEIIQTIKEEEGKNYIPWLDEATDFMQKEIKRVREENHGEKTIG